MAKSKKVDTALPSAVSDDKWRAESDARALMSAAEVMADPERLKKAKKHVGEQKKAFRCVQDLIDYRNEIHTSEKDDE